MVSFKEFYKIVSEHAEITMPKLFKALKETKHPLAGVHFTGMSEISLRPKPDHSDPIGTYCFPKNYVFSGGLKKNSGFASSRNFVIIEPTSEAKILNLDMSMETARNVLQKMGIPPETMENPAVEVRGVLKDNATVGHLFWGTIEYWRHLHKLTKNSSWNTLFSKTEYNTIYDPGKGIIHYNEPEQIVYMDKAAYRILDITHNNVSGLIQNLMKEFPDFRVRYKKPEKGWSYTEEKRPHAGVYQFDKGDEYFDVDLGDISAVPTVTINGQERINYSYMSSLNLIVDDIREALKTKPKVKRYSYHDEVYENNPLPAMAEKFGIRYNQKDQQIGRVYLDKTIPDKPMKVNLGIFYSEYARGPVDSKIRMSLTGRLIEDGKTTSIYNHRNYHYSDQIEYKDQSFEAILTELFQKMRDKIQKDVTNNYASFDRGQRAMKTLKLIQERVFRMKKT